MQDSVPWIADQGDGYFRNPIQFADFPDPDAIRVDKEFFLVCSTFSHEPGLTLLRSPDLVNWRHVGHALPRLEPAEFFARPRRGCGVWAPALRYHQGRFWIYYPDPDHGIYMVEAGAIEGPWSEPVLVHPGKGVIDPCPLWDDNGRAYLVYAWAKSRSGISNLVTLQEMSPDGRRTVGAPRTIIDGHKLADCHTLEGPKIYKRDGSYFVFAPAGGVTNGWQSVFRSTRIEGPYEHRMVLAQGTTEINGPHQGAWVDTPSGEDWFLHFQDRGPFGRILHLQPMRWRADGWPVIGEDAAEAGCGEPVLHHAKPRLRNGGVAADPTPLPCSDAFDGPVLGHQWQWEGVHRAEWYSLTAAPGSLRLRAQPAANLWDAPHVLTQRVVGPRSTITCECHLSEGAGEICAGLVLMARDYAWIGLCLRRDGRVQVLRATCLGADTGNRDEQVIEGPLLEKAQVQLRLEIAEGQPWPLSFSTDEGETWNELGEPCQPRAGIWVGARAGLFATTAPSGQPPESHADFPWWRVTG